MVKLYLLNEIDRRNLVGKERAQSPDRYNRRKGYKPLSYRGVDIDQLLKKDVLICKIPVGDYITVIEFRDILSTLKRELKRQPKPNLTLQTVIRTISKVADESDVLVDCSCPDFIYRYAYYATKYGYKYGKPERRPPKKTNPRDNIGSMCKHLTALLANKKWLVQIATIINDFIHAYPDEVRRAIGLSEDEFIINASQYRAGRARVYNKIFNKDSDGDNNEEQNSNDQEVSAVDKVRAKHNLDTKDTEDNEEIVNNEDDEELEPNIPEDEEELEVKDDKDNENDENNK